MTFFVTFRIEIVSLFTFTFVYPSGWADAIDSCHSLCREHYNGHQNEFSMFLSIPRIRFEAIFRSSVFSVCSSRTDCRRIRSWFAPMSRRAVYLSLIYQSILSPFCCCFPFVLFSSRCDRARYRIARNAYNNSGNRIHDDDMERAHVQTLR